MKQLNTQNDVNSKKKKKNKILNAIPSILRNIFKEKSFHMSFRSTLSGNRRNLMYKERNLFFFFSFVFLFFFWRKLMWLLPFSKMTWKKWWNLTITTTKIMKIKNYTHTQHSTYTYTTHTHTTYYFLSLNYSHYYVWNCFIIKVNFLNFIMYLKTWCDLLTFSTITPPLPPQFKYSRFCSHRNKLRHVFMLKYGS